MELAHSEFGRGRGEKSIGFGNETKRLVKRIKRTARLPRAVGLKHRLGEEEGDGEV